jgi:alpha-tubulin suppressor-like RCC1 family protein
MVKASNIYERPSAREGRISTVNALKDRSVDLVDTTVDLLTTPIYSYMSIPIVIAGSSTVRYQQLLRSEVPQNVTVLQTSHGLADTNYLWAWGDNSVGQLGDSTTTNSSIPVSVNGAKFNQVTSDGLTVAALRDDGSLWAWGDNTFGGIGNNSTTSQSSPVSIVTAATGFVSVSNNNLGSFFALDISGRVFSWGRGANGELGSSSIVNKSSPTVILNSMVAVQGSMALDTQNNCWSWGSNSSGQVGDGTTTNRSAAVLMIGPLGIGGNTVLISKSNTFGMGVTSDGICYSFGDNTYGSLGDGTTSNRSSPVIVSTTKNFIQICTGTNHALALDADGQVWSWGRNHLGQLGDGTTSDKSTPVNINRGVEKFVQIAARNDSSAATDVDGNMWFWGNIVSTGSSTSMPVSVFNLKARLKKIY